MAQEQAPGEAIAELARTHCIDCHQGWGRKGNVSLGSNAEIYVKSDPEFLRAIRDQLRSRNMPPIEPELDPEELAKSRPSVEEYDAAIADLGNLLRDQAVDAGISGVVLRRLNRVEYANAIKQLTGVEVDVSLLPSDDVGQAFDHLGEVLAMSPLLFEKSMNLAEATARRAIIDPFQHDPDRRVFSAEDLKGSQGRRVGAAWRSTVGEIFANLTLPRAGTYRAEFVLAGKQAGPDPVRFSLRVDQNEVKRVDVPESPNAPSTHTVEFQADELSTRVSAVFVNDFYQPKLENPRDRDRNAAVLEIRVIGPLEPGKPTSFQRSLEAQASRSSGRTGLARAARWLLERAWRRRVSSEEAFRVSELVSEVTKDDVGIAPRLRALLTYALVSPEFLFRLERPHPDAEVLSDGTVAIDDYSMATRLAAFIYASVPDEDLLKQARRGALTSDKQLRLQVQRMLNDPRSRAIAERFATQWLRIDAVERLEPDPALFDGVTESLLGDMRAETVLVFDSILREDRSVWELFEGSETFLSPRLASHYGIDNELLPEKGKEFQRVDLADVASNRAGLGVLAHASVLASTSNATRTSPVKRGKWILEALLDTPPPPAPPGVPQLPTRDNDKEVESLRTMLERHRADPECAICHVRMDALGLSLEQMDAVGRFRERDGDALLDLRATLPDGTVVDGPRGLGEMLVGNRAVLRSLSRHMLVYALGRGLDWREEPLLDSLVASLMEEPILSRLVEEIVLSPQFRRISVGEIPNQELEGLPETDEVDTVEESIVEPQP